MRSGGLAFLRHTSALTLATEYHNLEVWDEERGKPLPTRGLVHLPCRFQAEETVLSCILTAVITRYGNYLFHARKVSNCRLPVSRLSAWLSALLRVRSPAGLAAPARDVR